MHSKCLGISYGVALAIVAGSVAPAFGQESTPPVVTPISMVRLGETVDVTGYPRVAVYVQFMDDYGAPVTTVMAEQVALAEGTMPITDFSLTPADVGLQLAFIVHPGPQPQRAGQTGQATAEEARAIIRQFVNDYMREGLDSVAIWAAEADGPRALVPLTSSRQTLISGLSTFNLTPSSVITPTLQAALREFSLAGGAAGRNRVMIVLSPGWNERPDQTLTAALDRAGVELHGVLTRQGLDPAGSLRELVARTVRPGLFLPYTGPEVMRSLYDALAVSRQRYRLTYETSAVEPGERTVTVRVLPAYAPPVPEGQPQPEVAAALTYAPPVPDGPQVEFTSHRPGFRVGEMSSNMISVRVRTRPGQPGVDRVTLLVNGESLGDASGQGPEYVWVWDAEAFLAQQAALGQSAVPVEFRVVVYDQAGGEFGDTTLRGQAITNAGDACRGMQGAPLVGPSLYSLCRNAGITPPVIIGLILILVLLGVVIWIARNGRAVSQAGEQIGRRVTDVYRRLTRAGGKRPVLAVLDVIEGLETGARTSFELYGSTPLGRSPDYAELTFHAQRQRSPISGLHCTLHEDEAAGGWALEDEDSTNGTYLNGVRLSGLGQRLPVHDGDVIELAQVERGGLKFRFRVAVPVRVSPAAGPALVQRPARDTRPLRPATVPAADDPIEFDPRRQDF
jgi:hypothetical protein